MACPVVRRDAFFGSTRVDSEIDESPRCLFRPARATSALSDHCAPAPVSSDQSDASPPVLASRPCPSAAASSSRRRPRRSTADRRAREQGGVDDDRRRARALRGLEGG